MKAGGASRERAVWFFGGQSAGDIPRWPGVRCDMLHILGRRRETEQFMANKPEATRGPGKEVLDVSLICFSTSGKPDLYFCFTTRLIHSGLVLVSVNETTSIAEA